MYNSKIILNRLNRMEIHSSSLAFIPAGYNAKNRNDQAQVSNTKKETSVQTDLITSSSAPLTHDNKNNVTKIQLITDDIDQQKKTPVNSRTARAVNAYIEQNSEPLKMQRSELISGLDLFV